ncbi:MAG: KH domain-containing protein [Candidatus Aenigmarchaeota archaeon]|nr:KH domain-containing protein [Candidatus Aenigmarchaeota archaeon]
MNEEFDRKVVIPGEELGEGTASYNAYEEDGKVFSRVVGLAEKRGNAFLVIPLSGVYSPKRGDGVIGKISEVSFSKWIVDINSPYSSVLPLNEAVDEFVDLTKTDLTMFFNYGDMVFAEITSVSKNKNIQLSMRDRKCRKLREGRLIKVVPAKVPRIIGKNGSMVEMIKKLTGTQIVVGQNGIVWIKGENEVVATEAVLTVERMSQSHGLTDYIKNMLEDKLGVKSEDIIQEGEKHGEERDAL